MDPSVFMSLNFITSLKVIILMIVLVALFLLFGAVAAGVSNVTFFQTVIAATATIGAQWIVAILFSFIPTIGGFLGFMFSIIAMLYVLKSFFNITWGSAIWVFILTVAAEVSAGLIIKLYLGIDIWAYARTFIFVT